MIQTGKYAKNIIGSGTVFKGVIKLQGDLHIDGRFDGQRIDATHISIGAGGRVKTDIYAETVTVEGVLIGNIEAHVRTVLLPSARILGDINTPELIIQNGVIFEGRCRILHPHSTSAREMIEKLYVKDEKSI